MFGTKIIIISSLVLVTIGLIVSLFLLNNNEQLQFENNPDNINSMNKDIPKIIHQTWKNKELPPNFQKWSSECQSIHHNDWEYKLWTDEDNRNFIKNNYPEFLDIYDGYDKNIKRVDAVRYYYLYHFGGVYMDMDFICLKNLEPLLEKGKAIFGFQVENTKQDGSIANAFMASPPGHPLFKQLIDNLPKTKNNFVIYATGPNYLTKNINEYKGDDIVVHKMPIIYTNEWNKKNSKLKDCEKDVELCKKHFPNSYTTTAWTGTWVEKFENKKQPLRNSHSYSPDMCYDRLINNKDGLLISKDSLDKLGAYGWTGMSNNNIFNYYQKVIKEKNIPIKIYVPHCDFDPVSVLLGISDCSKKLNYRQFDKFNKYINKINNKFGINTFIATSCLYNSKIYYNKSLIIPCYSNIFDNYVFFTNEEINKYQWSDKINKIVWRGGCSGECHDSLRRRFVRKCHNNNFCDIKLVDTWCDKQKDKEYLGAPIGNLDQLQYKYILCLDGNSFPGNLEWVFFTGCVPVISSDWHVWFFKYLIPDYHYIKINTDLSDLSQKLHFLENNSFTLQKIALNALEFSKKYLNRNNIEKYINAQLDNISENMSNYN